MKEMFRKNKIKIIILTVVLILFLFLLLNTKNIYNLLKGETSIKSGEPDTLITNDMIDKMNTYDILAEVQGHDDNGTLKNFLFDDESIPIFNLNNGQYPNVYKMKVVLKFQSNNKDSNGVLISKKVKVSLKEGINLVNNGSSEVLPYLKNKSIKDISHTNKSIIECYKNWDAKKTTYNTNSGDIIYDFDSSVEIVTFSITVSPDDVLDFSSIKDAIKIELIENEVVKTSKSKSVKEDFSVSPISINGNDVTVTLLGAKNIGIESYNFRDNIIGLSSWVSRGRKILFKKIEVSVVVPDKVKLIGTKKNTDAIHVVGYEYRGDNLDGYTTIGTDNTEIKVTEENGFKTYTFIAYDLYNHCFGVIPVWDFSEYELDDTVTIEGLSIKYKTYGGEEQTIFYNESSAGSPKSKDIYKIVDKSNIVFNGYGREIYSYDVDHKEDEVHLGTYHFYNISPYESKNNTLAFTFDDNIAVSSISVPIMDERKNLVISYKKKWFDEKEEKWLISDQETTELKDITTYQVGNHIDVKRTNFLITKDILGLGASEYMAEVKVHNLTIPAYYETIASSYNYGFFGRLIDNSVSKIETKFSISNSDFCLDKPCEYIYKNDINLEIKYMTIYPELSPAKNYIITPGSTNSFKFILKESKEKELYKVRRVYNPIVYIRSEKGLPINNIELRNNEGDELIKKYNIKIESYSEESTNDNKKECEIGKTCIYKIDTKSIPPKETIIGFIDNKIKLLQSIMNLSFDMDIPVDFSDGGAIHKFNDMIYITDQKSNDVFVYPAYGFKGDPYDIDLDGKTTNDAMSYMNSPNYYQVVSNKDLSSIVMQKQSNETEYKIWKSAEDNDCVSTDNKLDLRFEIINNSGKKLTTLDKGILYIPIPKKGENWGDLSNNNEFNLSLKLLDKINFNNNDGIKYDIYYGINILPKKDFNSLNKISYDDLISEDNIKKEQLKDVNFIIIKINEFEINSKITIDIKLDLVETEHHKVLEQQFKYTIYRNLSTYEGEKKSGFVLGNIVGITNELSKYKLTVIHKDLYGEILETENYNKTYNEEYSTSKKDFENYEIFLEPTNYKGVIKENTEVTYVYRSTLDRKVIVHYYEKGTKNKLVEDKVLTGKELEVFVIKAEEINGYKVVDGKEIKGSFKEEVQEFIYEYEKEKIVVPSTLDNIVPNIIILCISVIVIIIIILCVAKKKKQK